MWKDKRMIEWMNEWFSEILENISDLDYIKLYNEWEKIKNDFSDLDFIYWIRKTSFINIELVKETASEKKYKIELVYNDSNKKSCYVDFTKIDLDFHIFVRKINNNIFNLLLEIIKDN